MGRVPVGDWRVGCIGRRSPGRNGGRAPGAPPGRGRWKMGCPGTGRPGTGRAGAPAPAVGAAGLGGALYTGRGPVWGTIIRGSGVCERAAVCAPGFAATGTGGCTGAAGGIAETGIPLCAAGGATGAAPAVRVGLGITAGAEALAGGWTGVGAGAVKVGLTVGVGTTTRGGA